MKDIKVQETKQDINSLDKNKTLQHFTKEKNVKEKSNQSQQDSANISDPSKKATNTVDVYKRQLSSQRLFYQS